MMNIIKQAEEYIFKKLGKTIKLPIYSPDATRGYVRGLTSGDLANCNVESIVVNTFHLIDFPGGDILKKAGGIKGYYNWPGLVISDSGGFQMLSMIYQDSGFGTISNSGIVIKRKVGKRIDNFKFTPQKCIEMQFKLGSDIIYCIDDCPRDANNREDVKNSVDRTIKWAKLCKETFDRLVEQTGRKALLFAVIQGGSFKNERVRCADGLKEIGFDGYGFGGWPLDKDNNLDTEIFGLTAELMENGKPKFALGVGNPQAIVEGYKMGYNMFDCVLPTRDGRHGKLFMMRDDLDNNNVLLTSNVANQIYIRDEMFTRNFEEMVDGFSFAFVNHLFRRSEPLGMRLASMYNLKQYMKLINILREIA